MTSIYDEYERYTKEYKLKYGPTTLVLMQVGSFFELYSANDNLVNMKEIGDLLGIIVSRKNKAILTVDRSNTEMAGFPLHAAKKFFSILLNNGYTVVLVEQVSPPPNPKRAVTQVLSPGTRLDDIQNPDNNYLCSVYVDDLTIGFALIDVSTGQCKIQESYAQDKKHVEELINGFVLSYNPREIVFINCRGYVSSGVAVHVSDSIDKELSNITYQQKLFERVYPDYGLLSVFEYLDIEKFTTARTCFAFLLRFAFQHNELILEKIKRPEIEKQNLILANNAISQLNVDLLCKQLNRCHTALGRRYFKERLYSPTGADTGHFDKIERFMGNGLYKDIGRLLDEVYDIERLVRRIMLKKLSPCEFVMIDKSLGAVQEIKKLFDDESCTDISEAIEGYHTVLDMMEIGKYTLDSMTDSCFVSRYDSEIDNIKKQLEDILETLKTTASWVQGKIEYSEKEGYYIATTNKRYSDSKAKFGKDWEVKTTTSSVKLIHSQYNKSLIVLRKNLENKVTETYLAFLQDYAIKYRNILDKCAQYVKETDYICTNARNAVEYSYCRPIFQTGTQASIKARKLRHPIVERIISIEYVANDIDLTNHGLLLYGINSCGKSTFCKSVALAVIMAQAGMFVAAEHVEIVPYKNIFSRIPCGDDIARGMSTFVVEMSELRSILKRADNFSLVCGDEIASGTEQISGLAIVATSIFQLYQRKTSFIFATHLHDLTKVPQVKQLGLQIYHLQIRAEKDKIIYDRILQPGQGSSVYGIEVCKALDMGPEFLSLANTIRRERSGIESNIVATNKSRYNKKVYVDICVICKQKAEEVHHIKAQQFADEKSYIGPYHKNVKHNLVTLCSSCHDKIHKNEITVSGYKQTSFGIELEYTDNIIA